MLKTSFKLFLRNLRQHPAYSAINIVGLAMSMSVCLLIIVIIQDQRSHDQFHEKKDRIFRVITWKEESTTRMGSTPGFVGAELSRDVPGIEHVVRFGKIGTSLFHEGKSLDVAGLFADRSFFDVFDFELLAGNPAFVLDRPYQLVLSEETAKKIFGDRDPIGEVVTLGEEGDFTITGVAAARENKSHLRFDVLVSFETVPLIEHRRETFEDGNNFWSYATYILLDERASAATVRRFLDGLSERRKETYRYDLQPLTEIALGPITSGQISAYPTLPPFIVLFFCMLGLVVMLAAGFNYVGLTVARSLLRAREVGIRKTVGAVRGQIVLQFLTESVFVAILALILACALLPWLITGFNNLSLVGQELGIRLSVGSVYEPKLIGLFLLFSIVVGLLAGLYPAVFLSRFRPARVLKGVLRMPGKGKLTVRKALIVLQLTFTLGFVITTVLVYRQFLVMVRADYGFTTENLVTLELQGNDYRIVRDELLRDASVQNVTAASGLPGLGGSGISFTGITRTGQEDTLTSGYFSCDVNFFETTGLEVAAGGEWKTAFSGSQGVVLNETAARKLGFEMPGSAIGESIWIEQLQLDRPIVGVVTDFMYWGPDQAVDPLLIVHEPSLFRRLAIRVQPSDESRALAHVNAAWKKIDPVHPVESGFYRTQLQDSETNRVFSNLFQIIGFISTIVLVVSCMGLMGLTAYGVQTRLKEVGIRKVMGAGTSTVVWLLSKEFLALLAVAVVVASPLSWLVNSLWLQEFANRVHFGVMIFTVALILVLLPVLTVIGSQTVRAALANPVDALRYE